ncbi:hypothetical protein [Streptomyces paludis]|uniref:Lipoprotein n=1 Tax=Streptomyces paludis TaxID=2282738 RepID=A0A345HR65_9ACTN|nr:hypothetical protein [Streptomyces paludis]AXG79189.1 hypothetical protein DVK44_17670 [Streptomyces paludis]
MSKKPSILLPTILAAVLLPLTACAGGEVSGDTSAGAKAGSGSGSGSGTDAGGGTADEKTQQRVKDNDAYEKLLAACMKKAGFEHTPNLGDIYAVSTAMAAISGADYELAKKYREKYGFGGSNATTVYPNDGELKSAGQKQTPNQAYHESLTESQQDAYMIARAGKDYATNNGRPKGCEGSARTEVYGSDADIDAKDKAGAEADKANALKLNGDAELVKLAQSYASCLTAAGLEPANTQPTEIGEEIRLTGGAAGAGASGGAAGAVVPVGEEKSVDEAKVLLTKEIEIALKDLECGKEFRAAYFPKFQQNPTYRGNGAG